jgi:hypothetical protein
LCASWIFKFCKKKKNRWRLESEKPTQSNIFSPFHLLKKDFLFLFVRMVFEKVFFFLRYSAKDRIEREFILYVTMFSN